MPSTSGTPTTENEKNEKPFPPESREASEASTLIGLAVSSSNEPADPANTIGISMCAAGTRSSAAITTTMGNSAAAAPSRVISALTTDIRAISDEDDCWSIAHAGKQRLPRPGGDSGRVDPFTDDEECCDEDDDRVAKARQRGVQREHAGRVQAECREYRDRAHRQPVPDEEHDVGEQNQQADGRVIHVPLSNADQSVGSLESATGKKIKPAERM